MIGAIVGDIAGSTREWHNVKSKNFELLPEGSFFTDDSVMTLAVAQWLAGDPAHEAGTLVHGMQDLGRRYPHAGYGGRFRLWLRDDTPEPYNSWGNGSGMRVSPVGLYARTLGECLDLAKRSAEVTHNHPEGVKGAQAIASATFMAKHGAGKTEIKEYITRIFSYNLDRSIDGIRPFYRFTVSCQGSVPEAIIAYLESKDFEDAIRNAISLGGDSDTLAAMAGAIAAAEYGIPQDIADFCMGKLTPDLQEILVNFENRVASTTKFSGQ